MSLDIHRTAFGIGQLVTNDGAPEEYVDMTSEDRITAVLDDVQVYIAAAADFEAFVDTPVQLQDVQRQARRLQVGTKHSTRRTDLR